MIATPAGSSASAPVDLFRALRAVSDRTRVVSEAQPDSVPAAPARTVARECSNVCGEGGRRAADELPTASVVAIAAATQVIRVTLPTALHRLHTSVAHALPPALGPPSALV